MLTYIRRLFNLRNKMLKKKQHKQETIKDTKISDAEIVATLMFPGAALKHENFGKGNTGCRKQKLKRRPSRQTYIKHAHKAVTCKVWTSSFEKLLFDDVGRNHFRRFLSTEFSEENVDFWLACEKFKNDNKANIISKSKKIFSEYIDDNSPKQINLDSETRAALTECLSRPTQQMFNIAQKRVQHMLENDAYRRFLDSESYKQLGDMS